MADDFHKQCYKDGLFSDLVLACQGKEYRVHKITLIKHSSFFAKALTVPMKEQAESRIEIDEDSIQVERMLDFCYTEAYTVPSGDGKHLLVHAQMYTMADKYGIMRLQQDAERKLGRGLQAFDSPQTKSVADLTDILAAISHIYHNTQERDVMRIALVRCPWESELLREHRGEWTSFLVHNPEYACDMTLYCSEKIANFEGFTFNMTEFVCPKCEEECIMNEWSQQGKDRTYTCHACSETYDWCSGEARVPEEQPESRSEDWQKMLCW